MNDEIRYVDSLEGVSTSMLSGFFVGWHNPPSPETHLQILRQSTFAILAIDVHQVSVIGFVTAVSDGGCPPTFLYWRYCRNTNLAALEPI